MELIPSNMTTGQEDIPTNSFLDSTWRRLPTRTPTVLKSDDGDRLVMPSVEQPVQRKGIGLVRPGVPDRIRPGFQNIPFVENGPGRVPGQVVRTNSRDNPNGA